MLIDEKFNVRSPKVATVQAPVIRVNRFSTPNIHLEFFREQGTGIVEASTLKMYMTADEALALSEQLIAAARRAK